MNTYLSGKTDGNPMQLASSINSHYKRESVLDGLPFFLLFTWLFGWLTVYAYVDLIASDPAFSENGFFATDPEPFSVASSALASTLPLSWLRRRITRPSDFAIIYLYLFVFIPSCAMMPFVSEFGLVEQMQYQFGLLLALGLLELRRFIKPFEVPALDHSRFSRSFSVAIWLLATSAAAILLGTGAVSVGNLSFEVYEQRQDFLYDNSTSRIVVGYVANWIATGIAPVLIIYGFYTRRATMIGLGVTSATLAFAATSFRSHLFVPLIIGGVYLLLQKFGAKRGALVLLIFALIITVVPVLYDLADSGIPIVTWTVQFRLVGNSGFLSTQYFQFFADRPKGLFYDTFGRFIFDPNYTVPISQLVGEAFSSVQGNHANANLWADGYGNFGWFGVFFASGALVIFLWIFDSICRRRSIYIAAPLVLSASFALANTSVHSMLTSNGGLLLLFLLFALPAGTPPMGEGSTKPTFRN